MASSFSSNFFSRSSWFALNFSAMSFTSVWYVAFWRACLVLDLTRPMARPIKTPALAVSHAISAVRIPFHQEEEVIASMSSSSLDSSSSVMSDVVSGELDTTEVSDESGADDSAAISGAPIEAANKATLSNLSISLPSHNLNKALLGGIDILGEASHGFLQCLDGGVSGFLVSGDRNLQR